MSPQRSSCVRLSGKLLNTSDSNSKKKLRTNSRVETVTSGFQNVKMEHKEAILAVLSNRRDFVSPYKLGLASRIFYFQTKMVELAVWLIAYLSTNARIAEW